jgi:DNA end-binding protein Ku
MRDKQYLAAIRPYGPGLELSTMLFADEVARTVRDRRATGAQGAREKEMGNQDRRESMSGEWKPEPYHDDYEEKLRDIIRAKSKGKTIEAEEPEESAQVVDLIEALRASLDEPRPRKATRRETKHRTKHTGA